MPFVRMMRMLSAMESGQLNGAGLEALLQDRGRVSELQVMLNDRALWARMKSSTTTMGAMFWSSTATATALAIATTRADILGSFLAQLAESFPAKMALSDSHVSLLSIAANAASLNTLRAASKYTVAQVSAAASPPNLTLPGSRYLLIGASVNVSTDTSGWQITCGTRLAGTTGPIIPVASSTAALSSNYAASLKAPYTVAMTGQLNGYSSHFGLLRCDA